MIDKEQRIGEETDRLAYAIFSEYIPLTKNNTRVVTETESSPRVKYGCTWTPAISLEEYKVGNVRLRTKWNGMSSRLNCRNISQTKNDIDASNWNRNTVRGGAGIEEGNESGGGVGGRDVG